MRAFLVGSYEVKEKRRVLSGTNEQKRILFRTYIRRVEPGSDRGEITVVFSPHYLQENMSHDNHSPIYISGGAESGV